MKAKGVQHIEYFNREHFNRFYHRTKAPAALSRYIDFFWETDFESLWAQYPAGFSDLLFPNIGYTFLINLGSPFRMQLNDEVFTIKSDAFLPRFKNIAAHHQPGNKVFGIKFKVSPLLLQKQVDFSEYKDYIFPLAYLFDKDVTKQIKAAQDFGARVHIVSAYYETVINEHASHNARVDIVTGILGEFYNLGDEAFRMEALARKYSISTRTLQRYFESATSNSAKKALRVVRIRKAIERFIDEPASFESTEFGYYDYSHFYKDMVQFIEGHKLANVSTYRNLFGAPTG